MCSDCLCVAMRCFLVIDDLRVVCICVFACVFVIVCFGVDCLLLSLLSLVNCFF